MEKNWLLSLIKDNFPSSLFLQHIEAQPPRLGLYQIGIIHKRLSDNYQSFGNSETAGRLSRKPHTHPMKSAKAKRDLSEYHQKSFQRMSLLRSYVGGSGSPTVAPNSGRWRKHVTQKSWISCPDTIAITGIIRDFWPCGDGVCLMPATCRSVNSGLFSADSFTCNAVQCHHDFQILTSWVSIQLIVLTDHCVADGQKRSSLWPTWCKWKTCIKTPRDGAAKWLLVLECWPTKGISILPTGTEMYLERTLPLHSI